MKDTLIEDGFFLSKIINDIFDKEELLGARREAQMNESVTSVEADAGRLLGGKFTMKVVFDERPCVHEPSDHIRFSSSDEGSKWSTTCRKCQIKITPIWRED